MTRNDSPKLTTSQVKVGDYLVRSNDHIGRPDVRHEVTAIVRHPGQPRMFMLAGYWSGRPETAKSLSGQNITQVERNGTIIGHIFVAYW